MAPTNTPTKLQSVLLPAVLAEPVSLRQLLQPNTLLAMKGENNADQVEQTLAPLRPLLVPADDVVMHVETALVTHGAHFLSARRTVPLSLGNGLHDIIAHDAPSVSRTADGTTRDTRRSR